MFRYNKTSLLTLITLVFAFSSCVKDNGFFGEDFSESNRKQLVKILDPSSGVTILARDAQPAVEEFDVVRLFRDPNNTSQANQPLTVTLTRNAALLPTGYTELPQGSYEVIGGTTVTFQAGEVNRALRLKVDKNKLDLSKKYGIAFSISNAGDAVISKGFDKAVYEIGIKNEWHGDYQATGVFTHPTAGDRAIDEPKALLTVGPRSVRAPLGDLGGANYFMVLTVGTDNKVTITPSGVTPNVDQSWGANYYDPATKTFHLHYSYNTSAPRIIKESLKRK